MANFGRGKVPISLCTKSMLFSTILVGLTALTVLHHKSHSTLLGAFHKRTSIAHWHTTNNRAAPHSLASHHLPRKQVQRTWEYTSTQLTVNCKNQRYTISYQMATVSNAHQDDDILSKSVMWNLSEMSEATKALLLSAPELFQKIPRHFLENFKNPCWLRGDNEVNCLPYFYLIGMRKCGTTDIWDKLSRHPHVVQAPKEPHWWGPRRHGFRGLPINGIHVLTTRNITGGKDDSSLEWYLNLYKRYSISAILNRTQELPHCRYYHPLIFGDGSISTATSIGREWIRRYPFAKEPIYTNADLIRALQPDAKIIMMIRNPTNRIMSWWWRNNVNKNVTDLHRNVHEYITCFNECLLIHKLRYCAYASGCPNNVMPGLEASIYHVFLLDWIRAFSRDAVHVILLEDWEKHTTSVYRDLLRFLEIPQLSSEEEEKVLRRGRQNVNRKKETALPETTALLDDFFKPYNKELAKIMGNVY